MLVYLTRSAAGVASFQKKKTFSSQVASGYLIFHMKWPGEAIWLIILPKNQTETKKFHFHFFPCFSPLSWLQVLELPWDHCVLTKKSFWIVQVDFFDLIFHLKSLSDHSGKIPVLVKNQGTFYLKYIPSLSSSSWNQENRMLSFADNFIDDFKLVWRWWEPGTTFAVGFFVWKSVSFADAW